MPATYCYLDYGFHDDEYDEADRIDRQNFDFQVREAERLFEQQRQQELLNFMIQHQTMNQMNLGL